MQPFGDTPPRTGYLSCLPECIRTSLRGTEWHEKGKSGGWGGDVPIEIQTVAEDDPIGPYDWGVNIIARGGLRLVKMFYEKYITPVHLGRRGTYNFKDLTWAIRFGHKNIFWYLFDLFGFRGRDDASEMIYEYVLKPMVKMSRGDWIAEYFRRFPHDVLAWEFSSRNELLALAFLWKDTRVIYELVSVGFHFSMAVVAIGYGIVGNVLAGRYGRDYDHFAEARAIENALYPVVKYLREIYPDRVAEQAVSALLPYHIPKDESFGNEIDK